MIRPNSCHNAKKTGGKNRGISFVSCKNNPNAKIHVKSLGSYELSSEAAVSGISEANHKNVVGAIKQTLCCRGSEKQKVNLAQGISF